MLSKNLHRGQQRTGQLLLREGVYFCVLCSPTASHQLFGRCRENEAGGDVLYQVRRRRSHCACFCRAKQRCAAVALDAVSSDTLARREEPGQVEGEPMGCVGAGRWQTRRKAEESLGFSTLLSFIAVRVRSLVCVSGITFTNVCTSTPPCFCSTAAAQHSSSRSPRCCSCCCPLPHFLG